MRNKFVFVHLLLFGLILAIGAWTTGTFVKMYLAKQMALDFYPWAAYYFSPRMSKLFNYAFTAAAFALFYFVFLSDWFVNRLDCKAGCYRIWVNILFMILPIVALALPNKVLAMGPRLTLFFIVQAGALFYLVFPCTKK